MLPIDLIKYYQPTAYKILMLFAAVSCSLSLSGPGFGQDWGSYLSPPRVEFLPDREIKLLEDFTYIDPNDKPWTAPVGSIADGASVPRFAWLALPPLTGKYRDASIIHDVGCDTKEHSWESTHRTFYTAMRASGVNRIKAKVMYAAVYHFGPRWPLKVKKKNITPEEAEVLTTNFEQASLGSEIVKEVVKHPASRADAPRVNITLRAIAPEVPTDPGNDTQEKFNNLINQIESEPDEEVLTLEDISGWKLE